MPCVYLPGPAPAVTVANRNWGRGVVGVRGTAASRVRDTRISVTADSTSPQGDKNVSHFQIMVGNKNVDVDTNKNLRYGDDVQCKLTCNINNSCIE